MGQPFRHLRAYPEDIDYREAVWGFFGNQDVHFPGGKITNFRVSVPLWPFLLMLLIAPVRWLFAWRESIPAFPVVTDATRA